MAQAIAITVVTDISNVSPGRQSARCRPVLRSPSANAGIGAETLAQVTEAVLNLLGSVNIARHLALQHAHAENLCALRPVFLLNTLTGLVEKLCSLPVSAPLRFARFAGAAR